MGASPITPRSFDVATSPCPKWNCQSRLASTRATRGFSELVSQRASQSRRPDELAVGLGSPGCFRRQHGGQPRSNGDALLVGVAALEDVSHRRACGPSSYQM